MKFLLISLNNVASIVTYLSFISFIMFVLNNIEMYKIAFNILCVSLIICIITPNDKETFLYFKTFKRKSK